MDEKHPIDKFFRDGLDKADIPFDEGAWTTLSRKMHPRRRRPLLIGIGSGIAAAVAIAATLLFGERELQVAHLERDTASQPTVAPTQPAIPAPVAPPTDDATMLDAGPTENTVVSAPSTDAERYASAPTDQPPTLAHVLLPLPVIGTSHASLRHGPRNLAAALPASAPLPVAVPAESQPATANSTYARGWTLGIVAAPDLSGTQPLRGILGGNIGLVATYRIHGRLSINAGVLYAKKRYQADFTDYRPAGSPVYSQYTPIAVDADCDVLDIPLNIQVDIAHQRHGAWFASTGISSYLMLKETYDYSYRPHQYGDLKQLTLHNQNRHILGVANLSIGYRRQLGSGVSVTVQPFVKVPLTGIGNGKLKLYSSGVALSADIDLTRRP